MANSLTTSISLTFGDGVNLNLPVSHSKTTTPSSAVIHDKVYDIGTSEETVAFGDTTPDRVFLHNLDATNFVEYGGVTTERPFRVKPLHAATVQMGVGITSLFLKADTASCRVRVVAIPA